MGLFFAKYDPRVEYFDVIIDRMTDGGVTDCLFRKALPFAGLKYREDDKERPLILQHFAISLFAAAGGVVLAGVALAVEMSLIKK